MQVNGWEKNQMPKQGTEYELFVKEIYPARRKTMLKGKLSALRWVIGEEWDMLDA